MSKVEQNDPREEIKKLVATKEDEEELAKFMAAQQNFPRPEEKHGVFQFLSEVLRTTDTSKVGNVEKEELEVIRNLKEGSLFFNMIGADEVSSWLNAWSEIILSTSDSRGGFLVKAAITQKKDVKLGTGKEKKKSSWLKQKESGTSDED